MTKNIVFCLQVLLETNTSLGKSFMDQIVCRDESELFNNRSDGLNCVSFLNLVIKSFAVDDAKHHELIDIYWKFVVEQSLKSGGSAECDHGVFIFTTAFSLNLQ